MRCCAKGEPRRRSPTDLHALRITGAELSSVTGDTAGEEARVAKADLSNLVRIQFTLGTLGAFAAVGMALLLRHSARRQSARFRSLVHNSSDLITVVDEHAIAIYQSPSSIRVLGYEPERDRRDETHGSAASERQGERREDLRRPVSTAPTTPSS